MTNVSLYTAATAATTVESQQQCRKLASLKTVEEMRAYVKTFCGCQDEQQLQWSHYEQFSQHVLEQYRKLYKALGKKGQSKPDSSENNQAEDDRAMVASLLKPIVGKLSLYYFYPTRIVTTRKIEHMIAAGVDHKCQFATEILKQMQKKWPKKPPVPWFESGESKKQFWNGAFGHPIGQHAIMYLREARNDFSLRVTVTVGK